jgi:hypothetical protein
VGATGHGTIAPGGLVFLRFGPLYASAWGLHAYRTMPIPYAQFLFSEPFLAERLRVPGIRDLGREREELQPLNRWRLADFAALGTGPDRELVGWRLREELDELRTVLRHPQAFRGRGLTFADLSTKTVQLVLRRCG